MDDRANNDRTSILLNWVGSQNGVTDIANFVPIIETGIVEPSIVTNTAGNLKQIKAHISFWRIVDVYHITKPFGWFVYNCRKRLACQAKGTKLTYPSQKCPRNSAWLKTTNVRIQKSNEGRTNAQQIRETSQGFLVSNTWCRTVATRANWPTHRKPAMRSDTPIPNLKTVEMPMSKRTKAREIATLIHVSSLLAIGESSYKNSKVLRIIVKTLSGVTVLSYPGPWETV